MSKKSSLVKILIIFLQISLFSPEGIFAQEAEIKTQAPTPPSDPSDKKWYSNVQASLVVYPWPILMTESLLGRLEFTATEHLSLYGLVGKEVYEKNRLPLADLGENQKIVGNKQQLAVRYYYNGVNGRGLFGHLGYEWVEKNARYNPGLFGGVNANSRTYLKDPFVGLGYRLQQSLNPKWSADFEANYEPGQRVSMRYIPLEYDTQGFFRAPTKARLETQYDYGFALRAVIGYRF